MDSPAGRKDSRRSIRLKQAMADQLVMLGTIVFIVFFFSWFGRMVAGLTFYLLLLVPSLMIAKELRPSKIWWWAIVAALAGPVVVHLYVAISPTLSFSDGISTVIVSASNVAILSAALILITIGLVRAPHVTLREIVGGLNIYLLMGFTWSSAYIIVHYLQPGSFRFPDVGSGAANGNEASTFFYYSFVTLTTLGYGDITPVSNLARKLTVMEAVVGQFYLATIVAYVISKAGLGNKD